MPTDSSISPAKPETAKGTDKDQDDNQDQDDRKNQDDKKDQDDNTDKDRPKNKNKNKNKNKSTMHIPDSALVVVRIQQSRGLEDALRVHLSPESLDAAGLAIGDPCEVNNEDGTVTAYGIAWRAEDRMNATRPKNRPIKVTETLRDLFDLKEGSRVTISRTRASLQPASKIMLTDVSPVSHNKSGVPEETCWKYDIGSLFSHSDAIAPGITFEITGKKKCRRRFYIEHVEGSIPGSNSCLYIMTDDTQIILPGDRPPTALGHQANGSLSSMMTITSSLPLLNTKIPSLQLQLKTSCIGGLLEQTKRLNERLRLLTNTAINLNRPGSHTNPPIIFHGYEGCGKTLLLNELAHSGFLKVLHLNRRLLNGGSVSKNQAIIQDTFIEAAADSNQPCLVVMDGLEQLAPHDDIAYADTLCAELHRIEGKQVLVAAATRSLADLHPSVKEEFWIDFELSIPDLTAREQIINVLRGKPAFAQDSVSSHMASRTHGFTGKDLKALWRNATDHGLIRYLHELDTVATIKSPMPPSYSESMSALDDVTFSPEKEVTLEDFESVLPSVKPTALREIFTEKPKTKWTDIGGSDNIKKSFDRIIAGPLKYGEQMAKIDKRLTKGVLLYGPPGCSKTLTAQAVASTYDFNFIAIKGAELLSSYVGESERAVREVFRKAKAAAPCVIFFDEIDSIGSNRDSGHTPGLNVLTTLLNEMDGFESLRNVLVLAATNKPEALDPALMRPGRFDRKVHLDLPNDVARKEILKIATRRVTMCSDVDFDALVVATSGYSGAEVVHICETAKEKALIRWIEKANQEMMLMREDFEAAIVETPRGITMEMIETYRAFEKRK